MALLLLWLGAVLMWASVPTLAVVGLAALFGTLRNRSSMQIFQSKTQQQH